MINLTTPITLKNMTRWQCLAPPDKGNQVTLRFWSPANTLPFPLFVDVSVPLSDVAGRSGVVKINPAPQDWNAAIIVALPLTNGQGGGGAANALTSAQNAYRSAANHAAGLRAIEGVALTDGWVDAALTGT